MPFGCPGRDPTEQKNGRNSGRFQLNQIEFDQTITFCAVSAQAQVVNEDILFIKKGRFLRSGLILNTFEPLVFVA